MLTLRQLRAFNVAAQTLSFTIAAQRLNLSQSAVSLLIRDLEQALGVPLFERGRRLSLTESGRRLLGQATRLLADLELAVASVRDAHQAQHGVLRIGIGHLLAATIVPAAAAAFRPRHPEIQLQFVDCLVEQLPQKVLDGEVDFGIGSMRAPDRASELRIEPLFQDTFHVSCPPDAAHAGQPIEPLPWRALRDDPLILVNAGNSVWVNVSATLARAGVRIHAAHQVTLFSTGIALARHGFGRLLVPGFCAGAPELPGLAIAPLVEPVVHWDVSVLYRRSAPPGPIAQALLRAVQQEQAARRTAFARADGPARQRAAPRRRAAKT